MLARTTQGCPPVGSELREGRESAEVTYRVLVHRGDQGGAGAQAGQRTGETERVSAEERERLPPEFGKWMLEDVDPPGALYRESVGHSGGVTKFRAIGMWIED